MHNNWKQNAVEQVGQQIAELMPLSGGDFADSFRCTLVDGKHVFVKTHSNPPVNFFTTEATGLQWLRASGQVNVPEVLAVSDSPPFLMMQWVPPGRPGHATEAMFGRSLARLHQVYQPQFGRPDGRQTGSLGVPNLPTGKWTDFYAESRLMPLAAIAKDRGALPDTTVRAIEQIARTLSQLNVPDEPPSLLHGDLWAGNRLVDDKGNSWLIDPAAHHGHREFDLAMMKLFGGFDTDCFTAYDEVYPLQTGWQSRIKLHQLAPLIVHAIKFGGSYVSAVKDVVKFYR